MNDLTLKLYFNFCDQLTKDFIPVHFFSENIIILHRLNNYIFYDITKLQIIKNISTGQYITFCTANNNYAFECPVYNSIRIVDINKIKYVCDIKDIPGKKSDWIEENVIINDIVYVTTTDKPTILKYYLSGKLISSINLSIDLQKYYWNDSKVRITDAEIVVASGINISFYDTDGFLIKSHTIEHYISRNYVITANNMYIIRSDGLYVYERFIG
jgi:hypothetical protein